MPYLWRLTVQLPGMSSDPVRLSLDITWYPHDGTFSMSRRLWARPAYAPDWQLEDMATTGSPVTRETVEGRWSDAQRVALAYFLELVHSVGPFD